MEIETSPVTRGYSLRCPFELTVSLHEQARALAQRLGQMQKHTPADTQMWAHVCVFPQSSDTPAAVSTTSQSLNSVLCWKEPELLQERPGSGMGRSECRLSLENWWQHVLRMRGGAPNSPSGGLGLGPHKHQRTTATDCSR